MVTSAARLGFPNARQASPYGLERENASRKVINFVAKAKALDVEVTPLEITAPRRLLPSLSQDEEFCRVSWRREKSLSLPGLFKLSWATKGSGLFRRHQLQRVLMPLEGERNASLLATLPEVDEMQVLEERRVDPILAVRVDGLWFEAYRWWDSPVLLPEDCPLLSANKEGERVASLASA